MSFDGVIIGSIFKNRIFENMPDDIDPKDIMIFVKNVLKEIKEEKKEELKKVKKEKKEKKENTEKIVKKRKTTKKVDENGNEIPRTLNKYQQFMKDNQQRIKDENPELNNNERMSKIAEEWKEYKKTLIKEDNSSSDEEKEVNEDIEDNNDENEEIKEKNDEVNEEIEEEVKEEIKEVKKKKGKK